MKVRTAELMVPVDEPFAHCKLGRVALAEPLTNLVASATDGMVMSIHAPWGQGKSTFFKMWHQHLTNKGYIVLDFNAWETDFAEDPMLALLGELETQLEDALLPPGVAGERADLVRQQVKTALRIGAKLLKRVAPTLIRVGSAGLVDGGDVVKELSTAVADQTEAWLKDYADARLSVDKFRSELNALALHVQAHHDGKPLIFLIDELDRCRPDYALRVLECVKHFFSVQGIVFVLGIDRSQLIESAKTQYGQAMDAKAYMRRFFDIDFSLPAAKVDAFAAAQFDSFGIDALAAADPRRYPDYVGFKDLTHGLFNAFGCSLRDVLRLLSQLNFALRAWPSRTAPPILGLFIVMLIRMKSDGLYEQIPELENKGADLWRHLIKDLSTFRTYANTEESRIPEAFLTASLATQQEKDRINSRYKQLVQLHDSHSTSRELEVHEIMFEQWMRWSWTSIEAIRKAIDLSAHVSS